MTEKIAHHPFGHRRCFTCGSAVPSEHVGFNAACSNPHFKWLRPPAMILCQFRISGVVAFGLTTCVLEVLLMTELTDSQVIDAAFERYKHECSVKYADNGPDGAFRTFDKATKSNGNTGEFPYDVDFPQITSFTLFGPVYNNLRHLAMAGFGAPFGLFAPMDRIHSLLAAEIIKSWVNAACFAVDVGMIDNPVDAEQCGYKWHLELIHGQDALCGPKSTFSLADDLAGFTEDGQPVLNDFSASPSSPPKGVSNGNSLTVTLCHGGTDLAFLHHRGASNDRAF